MPTIHMVIMTIIILMIPLHSFGGDTFRFAVFSDSREAGKVEKCTSGNRGVSPVMSIFVKDVLFRNASEPIKLLLYPGDFISGVLPRDAGSVAACNRIMLTHWMDIMNPLVAAGIVIRGTVGNHEAQMMENVFTHPRCGETRLYRTDPSLFKVLREVVHHDEKGLKQGPASDMGFTYSFDMGGCHFVFLNAYTLTEHNSFSKETLEWLDKDLQAAQDGGIKIQFVASHPPAFPGGGHMADSLPFYDPSYHCEGHKAGVGIDHRRQRDEFWNILKRHKVTAYFCGHEHNTQVQEVEGVWQVIAAGLPPSLYPLNGAPNDPAPNLILYDGKPQNPRASEIWPWNTTKKSYWAWCLVSVQGDRVLMDVYGTDTLPKKREDMKHLKRFVLREGSTAH